MTSTAAGLLSWLDESSKVPVMAQVQSWLGACDPPSTAAVPVVLEVDITALMCDSVELAVAVMHSTCDITAEAESMINQQLAMQSAAAIAAQVDLEMDPPPSIRLSLNMTQVPLPLVSPGEVAQQAVQLSSCPTAPSSGLLVSLLAVVVGASPPGERTHSARFACSGCGTLVDVLAQQTHLPCCNMPITAAAKEDLTGRVMVPSQQLWVSDLSSATGRAAYGVSSQPLPVQVPEQQVGSCSLGSIVHVIGHVTLTPSPAAGNAGVPGTACSLQVHANNIQLVLPHLMWALPPSCTASATTKHSPLHTLWECLSTALGFQQQVDPHIAMALLLSAAAVGGQSRRQQPGAAAEQVNLLVLHERFAPSTLRMLRAAAALLSPQSVAMPTHLAEHVNPITAAGSSSEAADQAKPVYASILHVANSGIAVADLPTMPLKVKQQLLSALHQGSTAPPKGSQITAPVPVTATCWAAIAWQDVCPTGGGGEYEVYAKPTKQATVAAAAAQAINQGFDICLGDGTVHEDELFWMLDIQSSCQQQLVQGQHEADAAATLRHLIAAAASCQGPVLSEAAQAFLGTYFLVVRQSLSTSSKVSKPALLASLVRIASAAARLHHRSDVLEHPDASLAVLLMEHTLTNKLGDGYHPLLELPCDLHPSNGRSLDDQLSLLHGIMARTFRQYSDNSWGEDVEGGCGAGDSGCSGLEKPGGRGGSCSGSDDE